MADVKYYGVMRDAAGKEIGVTEANSAAEAVKLAQTIRTRPRLDGHFVAIAERRLNDIAVETECGLKLTLELSGENGNARALAPLSCKKCKAVS